MSEVFKSDLEMDSKILGMELCTDGSGNWVVRVSDDHFLAANGSVLQIINGESIPESAVYSTVIKAQQVAQSEGDDLDLDKWESTDDSTNESTENNGQEGYQQDGSELSEDEVTEYDKDETEYKESKDEESKSEVFAESEESVEDHTEDSFIGDEIEEMEDTDSGIDDSEDNSESVFGSDENDNSGSESVIDRFKSIISDDESDNQEFEKENQDIGIEDETEESKVFDEQAESDQNETDQKSGEDRGIIPKIGSVFSDDSEESDENEDLDDSEEEEFDEDTQNEDESIVEKIGSAFQSDEDERVEVDQGLDENEQETSEIATEGSDENEGIISKLGSIFSDEEDISDDKEELDDQHMKDFNDPISNEEEDFSELDEDQPKEPESGNDQNVNEPEEQEFEKDQEIKDSHEFETENTEDKTEETGSSKNEIFPEEEMRDEFSEDSEFDGNEESIMSKISMFLSPEISEVNQEKPDARNVSIDFISGRSDQGIWSETMNDFWGKLRRARQGETEAVKDINSDLWARYKALIFSNEYARGDIADALVGMFLVFVGLLAITAGFISLFIGNVGSLDVLTQESGYADHIFITTTLLFITGLSLWLSRRTNSKTVVSAIRKPARTLEFTIVILQIAVISVVMYVITLGGGQDALGEMEQSLTDSIISLVSTAPMSVSQPIVSAIQTYRGPESITGFSIVESSTLMAIVGLIIAYPVLKRSIARFVLTANMGAREFREETGILLEEISEGSEGEFDEPDYVLGGESESRDGSTVTKESKQLMIQDEEDKEGLIALPDHVKGSPFADYEEVRRYWVRAPYAYVSIVYDERQNDYRYVVVEPELDETEKVLFDEIKTRLDNILLFEDVEEYEEREKEVQAKLKRLEKTMIELTEEYEIDINDETFHRLMYYIERDYVYYNKIDPLINDPNVEDISCDGEDQYIFIFHSDYKDIISNVKFGKQELRSFIQELAQRSGEHISAADPMVDASLPDGSRAQMTLGSEVTTHGSTFTIRLFEDIPFTPVDLLDYDTFSMTQMAYLWTAIEHNKSLIFAGGTASGKTTSMNAVSMFIPPKAKVITIEDTREISLPQKNWIPGTTREGVGGEEGGDDIDMYELLRAALRQRPEYIVVGEIRGREAETLFQAMNTGHTTYSTMHAETVDAAIGRLTNPPINVPKQMITALDIICIQNQIRFTDEDGNQVNVRRNEETREIVSLRDNGQFENRRPFQWDAETDTFIESLEDSHVLERVANENGWTPQEKKTELQQREEVLEHMVENDIREFDYVTNIIQAYMVDPEKIVREVRNDTLDPESLKSLTDMEWKNPEVDPDTTLNKQLEESTPETGGDKS